MNRDTLLKSLALAPDLLDGFLAGLTEDQVQRNRGKGLWTVKEHVAHLAAVQEMLHGRILQFRDESHPVMAPYTPSLEEERSFSESTLDKLCIHFREWREQQVEVLEGLSDVHWSREGRHPEYSRYTLEILATHIGFHDGFHFYRMEEMAFVRDRSLTTLP